MSVQMEGQGGDLIVGQPPGGAPPPGDGIAFQAFSAEDGIFTTASAAGVTSRFGGGVTRHNLNTFADALLTNIMFAASMPLDYIAAAGLRVTLYWLPAVATVGDVNWEVFFVRQRGGDSILSTGAFPPQSVISSAVVPNGNIISAVLPFTNVQADLIGPGDPYTLLVRRDGADVLDTMMDTAQLLRTTVGEV